MKSATFLTRAFSQRNIPPPTRLPLKTRPRLRLHHPLPPPSRHDSLHALCPLELAMVGPPTRKRDYDDHPGHVGLSVEGAQADFHRDRGFLATAAWFIISAERRKRERISRP